jgi:hypothetical protein
MNSLACAKIVDEKTGSDPTFDRPSIPASAVNTHPQAL